jgi:hypothetical protein
MKFPCSNDCAVTNNSGFHSTPIKRDREIIFKRCVVHVFEMMMALLTNQIFKSDVIFHHQWQKRTLLALTSIITAIM